jgi:hypothetical protein
MLDSSPFSYKKVNTMTYEFKLPQRQQELVECIPVLQ